MRILKALSVALLVAAAFVIGAHFNRPQPVAAATHGTPSAGWTIHIDAIKHFTNHNDEVAHHWCRPVTGSVDGMLQCQIYPSDDNGAPLVASEVIVPDAAWKSWPAAEQSYWHYHKTEIPKVNATMPDVSPAEAQATVAKLTETYGKVYILWDPMDNKAPIGAPSINNLEGNRP